MLIERDEPLAALLAAAKQAEHGQGRIVILAGEAGIGKSSLLGAFAGAVKNRVHMGGCEALFTPRPLGPLQDIAAALDAQMALLLDQMAPQNRIFPALLKALQKPGDARILVFEDVHWADNATLDLIKYLGRRIPLLRAVLVLSLRSDEVAADHPLAQVIGDLPANLTTRITLKPLSAAGVEALAEAAGRTGGSLHAITDGNPFFVTELLASAGAQETGLPASVRDAVWSRIARLPPADRALLEAVSIAPGGAEPWLVAALAGPGAPVDACVARGMLLRDAQGLVSFRHELARAATLERLAPAAQQALHARAGAALREHGNVPISRLAHHAEGARDDAGVLALAPRAAAEAAKLGSHREAAAHLEAALKHADAAPDDVSAQLREDWAYEAGLALQIDDAIIAARAKAVELWRGLGRHDKVAHNLRWLSRLHWYRGEPKLANSYLDEAIAALDGKPASRETAMAFSMRSQMHMLNDRADEAIEWGRKAIALAEELGDAETRVHSLNNVASALFFSGRGGGEAMMEESLALALEHGFHEQAARAYTNYSEYAVESKNFALAERILAEGISFDTQHDLDSWTYYLVGRQAQLRLEQGRLREAEAIAAGVLKLERLTLVMHLPALTVLARARMRLGGQDAPALLDRALADALATEEAQNIAPARFARVEAAWLKGDYAACRAELKLIAQMRLEGFDPWELGELSAWWRRAGMVEPFPRPGAIIAAPRATEVAGDIEAAAAEWTRLGQPYEAALALMQEPACLPRAVDIFDALGAAAAAGLARERAREFGVQLGQAKARRGRYGPAKNHPLGLTKREIEVLGLLAEGLGNPDIARRLARSQRTVEHHVSALLGKLNATSRMDIVLRLRNEPWLLAPGST